MRGYSSLVVLATGAMLSACATSKSLTYVGLADSQNSFVRTVDPQGSKCEGLQVFQGADSKKLDLNEKKFDQASVCEATLPQGATAVATSKQSVVIPIELKRVVILGDTGCRLKGDYLQKCEDESQWPFSRVVRSVQKENADLIIHVGDYHYREGCNDPVKCAPYKDTVGYGYKPWEADFFAPAAPLLKEKPFIFVRGNHEDCRRAHEGFSKMLTPLGEEQCADAQATRYTKFGSLLIVNFDNASLDDRPLDAKGTVMNEARQRFQDMVKTINARSESEVWIVMHKPIWGLAPNFGGPPGVNPVNINMQKLAQEMPLPSKVKFVFAGHIHNFQIAQSSSQPLHIVVGEGGTALDYYDEATRKKIPAGFNVFPSDHGYLVMEKDTQGKWIGHIRSYDGRTDFTCDLEAGNVPCK